MELSNLEKNFSWLEGQRKFFLCIFLCQLIIGVFLSIKVFFKEQQVVIIPAGFNKELTLSNKNISASYLEEMTYFFASNLLDLTPENFNYRKHMILRHVDPASYQKMEQYLNEEEKRYKEYNLSTSFSIGDLWVDTNNLEAKVTGTIRGQMDKAP